MLSGVRFGPGAVIVLIRHGETEWSRQGRHTSFTDVELTDHGRDQARALAERLIRVRFARVLASPRRRALETCELAGLGRVEALEELSEWNYGEYEGLTTSEIRRERPDWTIFADGAPGGETPAEVAARADWVLARVATVGAPVALVGHGHFLRVVGARWVGRGPETGALLALDPATISVLDHEREQRVLRVWNA